MWKCRVLQSVFRQDRHWGRLLQTVLQPLLLRDQERYFLYQSSNRELLILLLFKKPTALIGMPSAKEWTDLLFLLPEGQREPIVRLCDPTYVQTSLELFERKGASSEDLASLLASKQREHKENIAIAKAKMSSYFRTLKVCGWMEKTRSPAMERSLESDSPHPWAKYFHPDIIRDVHVFFPELRSVRSVV